MLLPTAEILPPDDVSTPVIRLKVVLLPAPFGPISATISRAWTSKETLLTAITPPNCLRAFSTWSRTPDCPAQRVRASSFSDVSGFLPPDLSGSNDIRSEERRVGKEGNG